jgi:hypothetical protein
VIFDAVIDVLAVILSWLGGLFGNFATPTWVGSINADLSALANYAAGLGSFVPISDAVTVMEFVFAVAGIGFGIKVVRIVASFFTAGGGSAS